MKKYLSIVATTILCLGLTPAFAQFGQMPRGSQFDGAMAKLFGDNSAFTTALETQIQPKTGDLITMPGKLTFDAGQTRLEINLSDAKGLPMPPDAAAQMKSMGLDQMITISIPKKKSFYLIYPGLQSYVENTLKETAAGTNQNFKIEKTEIGKETVGGHPCVENKVVVTDGTDGSHEYTVWNATDLKKFPVKIVHAEQGAEITMSFQNISLAKPDASAFEVPAGYTKYDDMRTMIQTEMMKKMGGGMGMPPSH